jgi:hypothetical protein
MVAWCAVIMGFLAVYPGLIGAPKLANPFGLAGDAGAAMRRLQASPAIPLITIPLFLASAAAPLVRFRLASGEQRQQLKWFAYAVGLLVGFLILGSSPLPAPAKALNPILGMLAVYGIAAAIGIAVLRYRLYDIDRLINRTLVYGMLTALLAGVYAGAVLVLGQLFGGVGGDPPSWVVAGATASRPRWTCASTDATTTQPRRSRGSPPGYARRSTSTRSRPSCWRWSTRRCSPQRRHCGCGHPLRGSRGAPGPKLRTRCACLSTPELHQTVQLGGCRNVVPSCPRSSRGVAARPVSNLVSMGAPVPSGRDAIGAPVPRDQGPIGWPCPARSMQAPSRTASCLSLTCAPDVAHANM